MVRILALSVCLLLPAAVIEAQSGAVIPEGGAGHAKQASCIILKRMGPADQITSHLYSFGIRGKQFQFIEGKLPEGFPFHGRLTDHDVRNLQGRGAEVIIMEPNYTAESLKEARGECEKMTRQTPNQTKATPDDSTQGPAGESQPPSTPTDSQARGTAVPQGAASVAGQIVLDCTSTPSNADIEIDGAYVGSTPSSVPVAPGNHKISIKKKGFLEWNKALNVSGGTIHINADLDQQPAQ
jgi:hypothetical protein